MILRLCSFGNVIVRENAVDCTDNSLKKTTVRLRYTAFLIFLTSILLACNRDTDPWIYVDTPAPSGDNPVIVIVGDSIAAGWLECAPVACEGVETHWWRASLPDTVTVRNRGIGNSTSSELLSRWEQDIQDADIVIILVGINDVFREDNPIAIVTDNLKRMHTRSIDANIVPVVVTLLPFNDDSIQQRYDDLVAINEFIREQERENNWIVLDLFSAFEDPDNLLHARSYELATGLHPNTTGYARLGAFVESWYIENSDLLMR